MRDVPIEALAYFGKLDEAYSVRTAQLIRARYSIDAELAILRQRDSKPEEFDRYNAFAEACKAQARREIFGGEA